jgi:hypothetical protein
MNEQEILDNAPEGATSYSAKQKQYWDWPKRTVKPFDSGHLDIDYPDDLRSIADIARIAELEEKIKSVGTILNIVKLNPMHDRATQVRRVFTAIEALNEQAKQLREGVIHE